MIEVKKGHECPRFWKKQEVLHMTFVSVYSKRAAHNLDFSSLERKKPDTKILTEQEVLAIRKALCAVKRTVTITSRFDGQSDKPKTVTHLSLGPLFALHGCLL